jgi:hypothetical protein
MKGFADLLIREWTQEPWRCNRYPLIAGVVNLLRFISEPVYGLQGASSEISSMTSTTQ